MLSEAHRRNPDKSALRLRHYRISVSRVAKRKPGLKFAYAFSVIRCSEVTLSLHERDAPCQRVHEKPQSNAANYSAAGRRTRIRCRP